MSAYDTTNHPSADPSGDPTGTAVLEIADGSGRHPVNVGHLVMGIAFLGLVGIWAAIEGDAIDGSDVRWLLPLPWVLGGLAGLLAIALGGRRRATAKATGTTYDPAPTTDTTDTSDTTEEQR